MWLQCVRGYQDRRFDIKAGQVIEFSIEDADYLLTRAPECFTLAEVAPPEKPAKPPKPDQPANGEK